MTRAVAYYDSIYLVATNEEKTSSHRVTPRDGQGRPGIVMFTGNMPTSNPGETYGTLVLTEELWQRWFGTRERIPSMATAEIAAQTLVSGFASIYYGCPLCCWQGKLVSEYREHVHEHINRFISQFRIEIEEEE